jgi:type I restriction enzyme M protein
VTRERAQSFLTDEHIDRIVRAYEKFKNEPGFTRVATLEEIRAQSGNLSLMKRYTKNVRKETVCANTV